ncbi:MAG: serine hydrolase, partial [Bacteroidales bacterium]|nr:serine hydrolase [Bacteroidales bacterium]
MNCIRRGIIIPALAAALISPGKAFSQQADPPFLKYLDHPWVDSVMKTLSTEKKVAQLVWIAGFASGDPQHEAWLIEQVKENGIGGIIFFSGNAERQTELIKFYRRVSAVPLMFATDAETGLGMRLADVVKFPDQLTLGSVRNDSLIYQMGSKVALQCIRAGININLAPVADINNNPENPVINFRSFGEDPGNVAGKTLMYMNGMQDRGIFAVAKHFPGHGDTETDSHLDLPVLKHTMERLDSVELVPFRSLIDAGVQGVMPGHLNVLSADSAQRLPATLSYKVLTGLLREKMNFRGLVLSDAMNMGGVTKYSSPGRAAVSALKAGIDVLEYVTDPASVIKIITESIEKGEISAAAIEEKCRKVLAAKYWAGLSQADTLSPKGTERDLSSPEIRALIRDLYASSLTLLENKDNILPLRNLDRIRIATVAVNRKKQTLFQERIACYAPTDNFFIDPSNGASVKKLGEKLDGYDVVIAGIYGTSQRPAANYGVTPELKSLIRSLAGNRKCLIVWFGSPYALARTLPLEDPAAVLLSHQDNDYTEDLSAQLIFGGIGARGMLPVTVNEKWKAGHGILTPGGVRMQYGLPENTGLSSALLREKVDSIVTAGIEAGAFPGCEVMIARKGMVVLHNTYGYQTYEQRNRVQKDDLYDLASVTKVSST